MRVNKMLTDVFSQAAASAQRHRRRPRRGQPAQNQTYFTAFGVDRAAGPVVAFPMSVGMPSGGPARR
jgi:hypothetical protein